MRIVIVKNKLINMGTHADEMINGETCSHCGTMFVEEHGYPVLCGSCWFEADEEEREGYSKATLEEL